MEFLRISLPSRVDSVHLEPFQYPWWSYRTQERTCLHRIGFVSQLSTSWDSWSVVCSQNPEWWELLSPTHFQPPVVIKWDILVLKTAFIDIIFRYKNMWILLTPADLLTRTEETVLRVESSGVWVKGRFLDRSEGLMRNEFWVVKRGEFKGLALMVRSSPWSVLLFSLIDVEAVVDMLSLDWCRSFPLGDAWCWYKLGEWSSCCIFRMFGSWRGLMNGNNSPDFGETGEKAESLVPLLG